MLVVLLVRYCVYCSGTTERSHPAARLWWLPSSSYDEGGRVSNPTVRRQSSRGSLITRVISASTQSVTLA